jgi:hypothetical protein
MASQQPINLIPCLHCGARVSPSDKRCWLCEIELSVDSTRPRTASPAPPASPQFALSTLLLVMTLACVGFGLASIGPGLTVLFLLVAAPALARLMIVSRQAAGRGAPLSVADKISGFAVSVAIILLAWVGAGVGFLGACFATVAYGFGGGRSDVIIGSLLVLAGVVALAAFVFVLIKTWPKPE